MAAALSSTRVRSSGVSIISCRQRTRLRPVCWISGELNARAGAGLPALPPRSKLPVLGLISAAVESQARVQQFEQFAGRSAMVGFLIALLAEAATEQTVFSALNVEQLYVALGSCAASISAAVALATRDTPPLGAELKEAVITSCTAVQRSAASVTQAQVDKALDYLMERAFSMSTLYTILADEDLV